MLNSSFIRRTERQNAKGALVSGFPKRFTWGGYPEAQPESIAVNYDYSRYIPQRYPGKQLIGDYSSLIPSVPQNPQIETAQNELFMYLGLGSILVAFFLFKKNK